VEEERDFGSVRICKEVLDATTIEGGSAAHKAVDFVPFSEE
jgi:hypothetical protein